jgi:hypothetical protein
MHNKELLLRRMESLESKLKRMRHALNERNVESSREILQEILELRDDITAIIEREH